MNLILAMLRHFGHIGLGRPERTQRFREHTADRERVQGKCALH